VGEWTLEWIVSRDAEVCKFPQKKMNEINPFLSPLSLFLSLSLCSSSFSILLPSSEYDETSRENKHDSQTGVITRHLNQYL
jgi:hypothetical protein